MTVNLITDPPPWLVLMYAVTAIGIGIELGVLGVAILIQWVKDRLGRSRTRRDRPGWRLP